MIKNISFLLTFSFLYFSANAQLSVYHPVQTDNNGNLVHWYNPDNHGASYDHCIGLVWDFWKNMDTCCGGHKYYMVDHSFNNPVSGNKIGGDQFAMALSSWRLYYAYTGDTDLVKNMVYIADHYLSHSLSDSTASWPRIPYPCNYGNTLSPVYDGDFLLGAGWTQPDKAGSIANELVTLYKITNNDMYLQTAINIANILAEKVDTGDTDTSPYPFKVKASDGSLPPLFPAEWQYTAGVVPTLLLFEQLTKMNTGNTVMYDTATAIITRWVKAYPLHTNNWGSFFEDIPVPSNTEINAVTMAWYILNHTDTWGNTWQQDSRGILDWTLSALGSHAYDTLGVTAIYEQSVDLKEAGSHTSRFAATELLYAAMTGDTSRREQALRQLDWANYLCDFDGKVRFTPPSGTIWFTDGYGDYVRHYLRAMAAYPTVAPDSSNHLLETSSVISFINYNSFEIRYNTYDNSAIETFRLTSKPLLVLTNGIQLNEIDSLTTAEGWTWAEYPTGGVLSVRHDNARNMHILWVGLSLPQAVNERLIQLYPNPANDKVEIGFSTLNTPVQLELTNTAGQTIRKINISPAQLSANKAEINISDLTGGIYFVRLTSQDYQVQKKLIVIK